MACMGVRRSQERVAEARRRAREAALANGTFSGLEADGDLESDHDRGANLCVVCFDAACDMVFTGCGHMCVCHGCSGQLARCPICRSNSRIMRVYQT